MKNATIETLANALQVMVKDAKISAWLAANDPQALEQALDALKQLDQDLAIAKTTRRNGGGGTWVRGTCNGYRFDALVFPEHAEQAEWEIGTSRISKLWIKRLADGRVVYNWDRGLDVPPADAETQGMVEFLCEGLAEFIYA